MISRIKGKLISLSKDKCEIEVSGLVYEVMLPKYVWGILNTQDSLDKELELFIYHYLSINKNRVKPIMIGFMNDLEREFFEIFISVSGVGPKATLKAFDKPISYIAEAIENSDMNNLKNLEGIGPQKAKQIIASLQGKVGRFALIPSKEIVKEEDKSEIIMEAQQILSRLQYKTQEIKQMVKKAFVSRPDISTVEDLLNEIYRQQKL